MIGIDFTDAPEQSDDAVLARWKEWNRQLGEKKRAEQAERDREDERDLQAWNQRVKARNTDGPQPYPLV